MKYKGKDINLINFQEEFKGVEPELLDEIITAIVYNVEIGEFIEKYPDNPELIKQIKWGILENLPMKIFRLGNEQTIAALRKAYKNGLRITNQQLENMVVIDWELGLEYIQWLESGVNLEGYNVKNIELETARNIKGYLLQGREMRGYFNGKEYSKIAVDSLELLKDKGFNTAKLFNGVYEEEILVFLSSRTSKTTVEKLIEWLNPRVKMGTLKELEKVAKLGIEPKTLLRKVDRIHPKRLEIVAQAYREGVEWQVFDDATTPIKELENQLKVKLAQNKATRITL